MVRPAACQVSHASRGGWQRVPAGAAPLSGSVGLAKWAYGTAESRTVVTRRPDADHCTAATVCFDYWGGGEALSLLFLLRAAWEVQAGLN